MKCPYQENDFCKQLSPETRAQVCAHCTIKKFAKGQHLAEPYFFDKFLIVLDGIITKMELDPSTQKMATSGIGCPGTLFSIGDLFPGPSDINPDHRTSICITDCVIASIDMKFIHQLFSTNVDFVRITFENCYLYCIREKAVMMRDIGRGDVYNAVRYVINLCRTRRLPLLTHEQIALICNRSRPTVTSTMHQLIKQEPELFSPLEFSKK